MLPLRPGHIFMPFCICIVFVGEGMPLLQRNTFTLRSVERVQFSECCCTFSLQHITGDVTAHSSSLGQTESEMQIRAFKHGTPDLSRQS